MVEAVSLWLFQSYYALNHRSLYHLVAEQRWTPKAVPTNSFFTRAIAKKCVYTL
jgi:hypothetical protein